MKFLPLFFGLVAFIGLSKAELRVRVSSDREKRLQLQQAEDEKRHWSNDEDEDVDIYAQRVSGNASQNVVVLEAEFQDGVRVAQLTDFKAGVQILRSFHPGEVELGQPPFQAFCFVSAYNNDLVAPEAVAKLRQKNPRQVVMFHTGCVVDSTS